MPFGGQYSPLSPLFPGGAPQRNPIASDLLLLRKNITTAEFAAAFGAGIGGEGLAIIPARAGYYHCAVQASLTVRVSAAYTANPNMAVAAGGALPFSANDQIFGISIRMDALAVGVTRFYQAGADSLTNVITTGVGEPLYWVLRAAPGAGWTAGAGLSFYHLAVAYYSIEGT